MHSIDDGQLPTDVKKRIENILAKHRIATNSISNKPIESTLSKETPIQSFTNIQVGKEIKLDPSQTIMSKTDARGVIEYANEYFMEISGYQEYELMGQPHNIIRHPDMPKVIFKEMWKRLSKGENIYALVKNLAKNGDFYWVLTSFETKYDENGKIVSHYARRKAAPSNAIFQIEKLYKTLVSIEKTQGLEVAEKYFLGMLEEKNKNYDSFILDILGIDQKTLSSYFVNQNKEDTTTTKKRGFMSRLFTK